MLNLFKLEELETKEICNICNGTGYDPNKIEQVYLVNFDFYTTRKMRCSCKK